MNISVNSWARIILLFGCFVSVARAELQWEQKTVQLDLHPVQVTGQVSFPFTNIGTNTVDILAVRTTCGCLKAAASTNQVVAGKTGVINVSFDFRDKAGPQRKAVAVRASGSKPVILYVQANVPEVYKLSAKRFEWQVSGGRASKTCRLVNQLQEPIRLISASSSLDSFSVELLTVREGFEYEVRVVPKSDARPGKATVTIQTECPPELKESRTCTFSAVLR